MTCKIEVHPQTSEPLSCSKAYTFIITRLSKIMMDGNRTNKVFMNKTWTRNWCKKGKHSCSSGKQRLKYLNLFKYDKPHMVNEYYINRKCKHNFI